MGFYFLKRLSLIIYIFLNFITILLIPVHPLISLLGESQATTALEYIVLSIVLIITMLIKLQISIITFMIFKILYF